MNTYEFWNDMDKIFDAIVAYQEKTIEFNKKFINPWVNLGKVFDKQESNEEVIAHKNAVEIDPDSAYNWYALANTYSRAGDFEKSIQAYEKAAVLGYETGGLYKSLAFSYAMTGKHQDSIPLFQKSIELFEKDEDKAAAWNHLGNVYRKLDNYEMALHAFQQADQLENQASVVAEEAPVQDLAVEEVFTEESVTESQQDDEPAAVLEEAVAPEEETAELLAEEDDVENEEASEELAEENSDEFDQDEEESEEPVSEDEDEEFEYSDEDMPVILEIDYSIPESDLLEEELVDEQPVSEFLAALEKEAAPEPVEQHDKEVEAEAEAEQKDAPETVAETASEIEQEETIEEKKVVELAEEPVSDTPQVVAVEVEQEVKVVTDEAPVIETSPVDAVETEEESTEESTEEQVETVSEEALDVDAGEDTLEEEDLLDEPEIVEEVPVLSAYEEFLRDHSDAEDISLEPEELEEAQTIAMAPVEVGVTHSEFNINAGDDVAVEMDTKNAYVWNELGNVYFNAGSFDDAIAAYNKAIDLDKSFAWPYTNLALSYVQKGRLEEAILLYQRSIELFTQDKDKAVTWNRLGNVYRRLNDYEKAIAAYQRADELDPGNVAVSQQSRFSLLGNEKVEQEVSYSV